MIVRDPADVPLMGAIARLQAAAARSDLVAIPGLCKQIEGLARLHGPEGVASVRAALIAMSDVLGQINRVQAETADPVNTPSRGRQAYLRLLASGA